MGVDIQNKWYWVRQGMGWWDVRCNAGLHFIFNVINDYDSNHILPKMAGAISPLGTLRMMAGY